jgi:hypothetical protein
MLQIPSKAKRPHWAIFLHIRLLFTLSSFLLNKNPSLGALYLHGKKLDRNYNKKWVGLQFGAIISKTRLVALFEGHFPFTSFVCFYVSSLYIFFFLFIFYFLCFFFIFLFGSLFLKCWSQIAEKNLG